MRLQATGVSGADSVFALLRARRFRIALRNHHMCHSNRQSIAQRGTHIRIAHAAVRNRLQNAAAANAFVEVATIRRRQRVTIAVLIAAARQQREETKAGDDSEPQARASRRASAQGVQGGKFLQCAQG